MERLKLSDNVLKGFEFRDHRRVFLRRHSVAAAAVAAAAAGAPGGGRGGGAIRSGVISRFGGGVIVFQRQSGGGQKRRRIERNAELSGAEYEQFAPRLLQERELILERQRDESRNILRPFDRHEEDSGRGLANGLRVRVDILKHFVRVLLRGKEEKERFNYDIACLHT